MKLINNLPIAICTVFLCASGSAGAQRPFQTIELCDIGSSPAKFDKRSLDVSGIYFTSYHGSYLYSRNCPDLWFNVHVKKSAAGKAVSQFRAAMEDRRRMRGGDYQIELYGAFHEYSGTQKRLYNGVVGFFEVDELSNFQEIIVSDRDVDVK